MTAVRAGALSLARGAHRRPVARGGEPSLVAVLCAPARGRVAAAGLALALVRALGAGCGIAGVLGGGMSAALVPSPAGRRAVVRLRERGLAPSGSGRLVWLPDRRGPLAEEDDAVARAAATSAELAGAAAAAGIPAVVALPLIRTAALDRVLAWHDAIVVVREPGVSAAMIEQALASLAALGRPVAAMAPPTRLAAALAVAGVRAPVEAQQAVAALGLEREARDG